MAVTRVNVRRSTTAVRTAARKRRAMYLGRIERAERGRFRARFWAVLGWLMAEAKAAPPNEQEQLLAGLRAQTEAMNNRRQR